MKRATLDFGLGLPCGEFQSTPSQRGRPSPLPANWDWCMNFNPRPRKEGDSFCTLYKISRFISIHALVKRATLNNLRYFQIKTISIHALVKRATVLPEPVAPNINISIHALVKRATIVSRTILRVRFISIHALVKRATIFRRCQTMLCEYFNPRPRKEGDRIEVTFVSIDLVFQSTPS